MSKENDVSCTNQFWLINQINNSDGLPECESAVFPLMALLLFRFVVVLLLVVVVMVVVMVLWLLSHVVSCLCLFLFKVFLTLIFDFKKVNVDEAVCLCVYYHTWHGDCLGHENVSGVNYSFIQDHSGLNLEKNKCLIISETVRAMPIKFSEDSPTQ